MSDCVFRLLILLVYLFILTQVLGLDHPFTAATRAELLRCQGAPRGRYLALFVHFIQLFFRLFVSTRAELLRCQGASTGRYLNPKPQALNPKP